MKSKFLKTATIVATCAMLSVIPVSAATESYHFVFKSTDGALPVNSGYKNDTEQNYYITISGGNLSSANVFGTRIRRSSDNAFVSNYVLHKAKKQSKAYAYTSKVDTDTLYYMRGKKDTSSTTSTALEVSGRVTY
ncbi:MAG: hypothetical protein HDR01_01255 [Lachnospiraceae bacterium]|nr:hypothetical protein [Lachnospiraceae bacterium]